jgi:hypothetical protein
MAVPAARSHVHFARAFAGAHLERGRSGDAAVDGLSRGMAALHRQSLLDGRQTASLGPGGAYVGRLFHGRVPRGNAADQYDAPERRLLPPQWRAFQRPGHARAILAAARGLPDLGDYSLRPGVSERTDDSQLGIPPGGLPADSAVSVRRGRGGSASQGRGSARIAGFEQISGRFRQKIRSANRNDRGRRGEHVSGRSDQTAAGRSRWGRRFRLPTRSFAMEDF